MQTLTFIAIGIVAAAVIISFINFRFLLYPLIPGLNPIANARRLSLEGNTFFISDLHLRAGSSFEYSDNLHRIFEQRGVSNLVVVGDLFDSPEDAKEMFDAGRATTLPRILGVNDLPIALFFVHGSPEHDPDSDQQLTLANFELLGHCAIISCGRFTVVVYHGHDMSRKGAIGHGWDRFIAPLSLERAWKRFARVQRSDWLILGHLHIPGVDVEHRIANCGGWQTISFLVRPACTGIFLSPESNAPEIVKVAEPEQ
jgi:UDP-2,3-diacylglucosamine pyrophosphatase LpxH